MEWYFQVPTILSVLLIAGPLIVEVTGYFWHRFVAHEGTLAPIVGRWAADAIRRPHWQHHEEEYPETNLRPASPYGDTYRSAGDWSWHVLAVLLIGLFIGLAVSGLMPLYIFFPLIIGGLVYAKFAVANFHKWFHLPRHPLHNYQWFQDLIKYHDIHHWEPSNYGIVFMFMDRLCGTFRSEFPLRKTDIFNGYRP